MTSETTTTAPEWATVFNQAVLDIERHARTCDELARHMPLDAVRDRERVMAKASTYRHAAQLCRQRIRMALADAELAGEDVDAVAVTAELGL